MPNLRYILLNLLLFFFWVNGIGQVINSSCEAKKEIIHRYINDADRLSIRQVNKDQSSYRDSVRINKSISSDFLNALIAVHNCTQFIAVDTIIRFLTIHTYNPGLNSLIVVADSNLFWMRNLRYNISPAGENLIDKMMVEYALEVVFYSGLLQPSMVVFKTNINSNLAPLAKKVKTLLGVKAAEAEFLYGDGNDITGFIGNKYTELVYSYGWQQCPTGCELRRYWKFRVFSDCSVQYLGSYGSVLEPSLLLSVSKDERSFDEVKIYTNPVKNKIYIDCSLSKFKESALIITDKNGKTVYSLSTLVGRQEIDLILLSRGEYQLTLMDKKKQKIYKIVKQ